MVSLAINTAAFLFLAYVFMIVVNELTLPTANKNPAIDKTPATSITTVAPGIPVYQKFLFGLLPLIPITIIVIARFG